VSLQRQSGYSVPASLLSFGVIDAPAGTHGYEPPGMQSQLQVTTLLDDVRMATQRVASSAMRVLSLCTTDLEPQVYDQPYFLEAAKALILGRAYARIRILVRDQGRMIATPHRLLSMARRASHSIDIRAQPEAMGGKPVSYCFSDAGSMLYRARADRWDGVTAQRNPEFMQRLMDEYEAGWRESATDIRRIAGSR
jgi:hypothetical protein